MDIRKLCLSFILHWSLNLKGEYDYRGFHCTASIYLFNLVLYNFKTLLSYSDNLYAQHSPSLIDPSHWP